MITTGGLPPSVHIIQPSMLRLAAVPVIALALIVIVSAPASAQQPNPADPKDEATLGWSGITDLSLVVTAGNSSSATVGFSGQLRYVWPKARFEFELNMLRSNESDDRYFLVDSGLEFPVGGAPSNPPTSLIAPKPTLDVANSLVRSSYERNLSSKWFWNTGGSWYRNNDAGILSRYIVFVGVGNTWADDTRRRLVTSYGFSYTDREEEEPDPEKDRRFGGARAGWDYIEHVNASTTFDSDLAVNINLSDGADYSIHTINALSVAITKRIALKVSLQWLFENQPALEPDLDVIAYVEILNPDGIPGSGDERFRTLSSGGTKLMLGSANARKDKLDTVVQTALAIRF